jgi:hypothetical protein
MCCNGTLYDRAKVAPGEAERMKGSGLSLLSVGNMPFFQLPCPKESCGTCTIYETRFEICRSFSCALLTSYQAGEVTLDRARDKVSKAQELLAVVVAQDPQAAISRDREVIRRRLSDEMATGEIPNGSEQVRGKIAQRLLNIIALDVYLERWFRNKKGSQEGYSVADGSLSKT